MCLCRTASSKRFNLMPQRASSCQSRNSNFSALGMIKDCKLWCLLRPGRVQVPQTRAVWDWKTRFQLPRTDGQVCQCHGVFGVCGKDYMAVFRNDDLQNLAESVKSPPWGEECLGLLRPGYPQYRMGTGSVLCTSTTQRVVIRWKIDSLGGL